MASSFFSLFTAFVSAYFISVRLTTVQRLKKNCFAVLLQMNVVENSSKNRECSCINALLIIQALINGVALLN